jgi:hypothetical protein
LLTLIQTYEKFPYFCALAEALMNHYCHFDIPSYWSESRGFEDPTWNELLLSLPFSSNLFTLLIALTVYLSLKLFLHMSYFLYYTEISLREETAP